MSASPRSHCSPLSGIPFPQRARSELNAALDDATLTDDTLDADERAEEDDELDDDLDDARDDADDRDDALDATPAQKIHTGGLLGSSRHSFPWSAQNAVPPAKHPRRSHDVFVMLEAEDAAKDD